MDPDLSAQIFVLIVLLMLSAFFLQQRLHWFLQIRFACVLYRMKGMHAQSSY